MIYKSIIENFIKIFELLIILIKSIFEMKLNIIIIQFD